MKKKIISIVLIFILLQSVAITCIAASTSELNSEKNKVQSQLDKASSKKKEITAEKDTILNEISDLEDSIDEYQDELDELNSKIKKLEAQIKTKGEEIKELQDKFDEMQQLLTDRLVAIYEEGQVSFLDVLLSAESVWDYVSLPTRIQELTESDNAQMDKVEKQRVEVEKAQKELEEQNTELTTAKKSAQAKQNQLKTAKASRETKVASLTKTQKALQSEIDKYNKEIDRIEKEIEKAAQASNGHYTGSIGSGSGVLSWPLPYKARITSYFGARTAPVAGASTYHRGIDIGVPVGTAVYSAADGYVVTKGYSSVRGNYVMVKHANNLYTFYQHLSSVTVSQGQNVKRGQTIARSGNTGIGSGPHLHFEVRTSAYYGSEVNPLNYL